MKRVLGSISNRKYFELYHLAPFLLLYSQIENTYQQWSKESYNEEIEKYDWTKDFSSKLYILFSQDITASYFKMYWCVKSTVKK